MKDIHRSEKLDAMIGKSVRVYFTDGSRGEGVLGYCEKLDMNHGRKPGEYFLQRQKGDIIFRKTNVKKIFIPRGTTR